VQGGDLLPGAVRLASYGALGAMPPLARTCCTYRASARDAVTLGSSHGTDAVDRECGATTYDPPSESGTGMAVGIAEIR
jgi:hypothetical protein